MWPYLTTWLEVVVVLWVSSSHYKALYGQVLWSQDIGFFLDYHVISNDFVVKESRNIMREFPSS